MLRNLIILGVCAGSAASIPILYQSHEETVHRFFRPAVEDDSQSAISGAEFNVVDDVATTTSHPSGRKVMIAVGPDGHFAADFRLNGRSVGAIVDTGATLVAINLSTARRIGISVSPRDFRYSVNTANGTTRAAGAVIKRLQIGRIAIEDVKAVVLDDSALSGTLIGASFLNRLAKYQVENGSLLLVQ